MNTSSENTIEGVIKVTPSLKIAVVLTALPLVIVGSLGNICVIITIIRKRSLRTASNYFTLGLMFFSLLHVALSYPLQVLTDLSFFTRQPACYLAGNIIVCTSIQMVLYLPLLSIERYITITRPLVAYKLQNPNGAIFLIGFVAVYGLLVSFGVGGLTWIGKNDLWQQTRRCNVIFMIPSKKVVIFLISHHVILIPIMFSIYLHLFITVRRHIHAISVIQRPTTSTDETQTTENVSSLSNSSKPRRQQSTNYLGGNHLRRSPVLILQEAKSALRLFFVLAVYIMNWVPVAVFLLTGVVSDKNISPYVYVLIHTFAKTAVVIAPYIYGFGNRKIRKEAKMMLFSRWLKTKTDDAGNTVYFVNKKRRIKLDLPGNSEDL